MQKYINIGLILSMHMLYAVNAYAGDIVVTMGGNVSSLSAGGVYLTGTATGAPEASDTNQDTTATSIASTITTPTSNAWLVDIVSSGDLGSFTQPGDQTERWDISIGGNGSTGAMSTKVATTAPDTSTQNFDSNANRLAHAVISIAPTSTIAFDSVSSASDNNANTLNWTHTFSGTANGKLIVGISVEEGNNCNVDRIVNSVTHDGVDLTFITAIDQPSTPFCNRVELWYLDFVEPIANYQMDEIWTVPGSGEVLDYSGNANHGDTISSGAGTPISNASTFPALGDSTSGTCGYGVFPANNNNATRQHAVDSKLTPGSTGSVTFWYRSDTDWDVDSGTGHRKLLDATNGATSRFYLFKNGNNGRLIFRLDDGGGNQAQAITPNQTFLANQWVHIGITWDLPNNLLEIYINGALADTGPTTDTTAAAWNSLYIGDNRAVGVSGIGTNRSAGGLIDETRIYDIPIPLATVVRDRDAQHPCTLIDHYQIKVLSSSPGSCAPIEVEITAHNVAHTAVNVSSGTILNFSTLLGSSNWESLTVGSGTWNPTGATATYTWPVIEESSVQVGISNGATVTENINLDDGSSTDLSGDATEDPDIDFSDDPIIRISTDGSDDGSIATEISGKDSDQAPSQTLFIQLKNSGSNFMGQDPCEVSGYYNGAHPVQVALECNNPSNCSAQDITVEDNTGTPITITTSYSSGSVPASLAGANGTTVTMDFDGVDGDVTTTTDNKASLVVNYPDAGLVTIHFETTIDPAGGSPNLTYSGTSNGFVVRPFGFRIDDFSPTNPAATAGTGTVFTKAGQNFTADISAVVWELVDDNGSTGGTSGDGIPDSNSSLTLNATTPNFGNESSKVIANISHTLIAPDPAVITGAESGTLTGGGNISDFGATVAGAIDDHTMSWDEVGIIQLDVNESNNSYLSGGQDITGQVPYVGRFTPANLTVAVNLPAGISPDLEDACATGPFTYMGQEFYYDPDADPRDAPRIRVRGVDTSGGITFNYDTTEFFKLDTTTLPRSYSDQSGAPAGSFGVMINGVVEFQNLQEDNNPNGNIFLRLQDGSDGDRFMYDRVSEVGPFTGSVDLTFEAAGLKDTDGVCYDGDGDTICDDTTPTPSASDDDFLYGNITGTTQRFGRLVLDNAFGSELLPLNIPVRAEYFDGDDFINNTDDVCSTYRAGDVTLNEVAVAPTDTLEPGDTTVSLPAAATALVNGLSNPASPLVVDAPGAGNTGNLDAVMDMSTTSGSDQEWLRFDWDGIDNAPADGDLYDDDPKSRISFGIYSGPDEFIYIRESVNF
jgi:MSHA biogenesis protein MshQ